jgi:hypothetical protein
MTGFSSISPPFNGAKGAKGAKQKIQSNNLFTLILHGKVTRISPTRP